MNRFFHYDWKGREISICHLYSLVTLTVVEEEECFTFLALSARVLISGFYNMKPKGVFG